MLYIGCAVWAYDGWANNFFPPGTAKEDRLQAYARRLTGVEINSTFYAVPPLPTVRRWANDAPSSFRFCPKFPKAITHTAQLKEVGAQTASFIGVMRLLSPRLGPLMLQLPPSFSPLRLGILHDYLTHLPNDLEIAVEVRHPDWFTPENNLRLDQMLSETNASRVVFDVRPAHRSTSPDALAAQERKPNVPLIPEATQPFVVLRYIGSPVISENDSYFAEWVPRLANWLREERAVYCFIHCPLEERSPGLARELYHRVSAVVALPPLPWDDLEQPASPADLMQLPLF